MAGLKREDAEMALNVIKDMRFVKKFSYGKTVIHASP